MTTDTNILREMLERATNPTRETIDELGVQMFCMVAKNNVSDAQEMIVTKIRSHNEMEAIRAIALLEECMAKSGAEFQDEVGKFRFLNDLIRLVSNKYEGPETPPAIKQRIMDCLLLWTTAYPQKTKIREAYDSLNKEDGVDHGNTKTMPPSTPASHPQSILGKDEDLLKQLIKANDHKRANLLIQYRVRQDERRSDFMLQHKKELLEVDSTVALLNQMLSTYEVEGIAATNSETMDLLQELYTACKKHKNILHRLLEMKEDVDKSMADEAVLTNHGLLMVLKRYKDSVIGRQPATTNASGNRTGAPGSTKLTTPVKTSDLLTDLLEINGATSELLIGEANSPSMSVTNNLLSDATTRTNASAGDANVKTLDELHAIFGSLNEPVAPVVTTIPSIDCLEPVSVSPGDGPQMTSASSSTPGQCAEKPRGFRELREIDELSAELFKQSLAESERQSSFKRNPERVTLNDLAVDTKRNAIQSVNSTPTKITKNQHNEVPKLSDICDIPLESATDDDRMLDGSDSGKILKDLSPTEATFKAKEAEATHLPIKHLSEIELNLDDITPTDEERLLLDDDDIKITLNFTENRPSKQVSVIVVSMVNKSKMAVKDFQFEASAKKPSKIRLLPPTETSMPPFKSFRPPTPINQVMLVLNPTGKAVDITCIVGYKLGTDPDPIKESIVANNIPYVE